MASDSPNRPLSSNPPGAESAFSSSNNSTLDAHNPDAIQKAETQHLEQAHPAARQRWVPEYGPLAQIPSNTDTEYYPAFGGDFQPGLYKPPDRKFGNPAPLGLSGFALTTFLLSLLNLNVRGIATPSIIIAPALAYGGFIQLLAGMWEVALGNTFGATALASYGGFWIGLAIIFIPGGFEIEEAYGGGTPTFYTALAFYIYGWMIFTFLMWLLTLRSTLAFSSLLFSVFLAFLCLATGYLDTTVVNGVTSPNAGLNKAGGVFGIIAAFLAWWIMLAGIADKSNSLFLIPVAHFPWSEKGRERKNRKMDEEKAA